MKGLLLDTHVLFWYASGDGRLPSSVASRLRADPNPLAVSVASVFEMAIARAKGRWPETDFLFPDATARLAAAGYTVLPIEGRHVELAAGLPRHHNDPWDRLLIGTARADGLTLVTADRAVQAYGGDWLWG